MQIPLRKKRPVNKLLILLIFFGSIAVAEPIVKDDGVITNVVSTIYFHSTYESLEAAYPDEVEETEIVEGFSICERRVEENIAYCIIHTLEPQQVDGEHTLTLGHEIEHGIYGPEYHQ